MEIGVRDWMIIVGVLLILALLLDGYRRVRNERRGNIRMSLNKKFINAEGSDDPDLSTELPNGGGRVVHREENSPLNREPVDLEQAVPMLMDAVAGEVEDERLTDSEEASPQNEIRDQASSSSLDELDNPHDVDDVLLNDNHSKPNESPEINTDPQEVMVINVVAKNGVFKGPDLLHILLACDLRFGSMNIFHRYEKANGKGAKQFSMANSVEPGTFDLEAIDDFTTPSVCFFMSVPGPQEPLVAFECMVETAQCLVSNLDGEMRDESRSVMTNQTLEHCRQRLQEFERRQLAQHA